MWEMVVAVILSLVLFVLAALLVWGFYLLWDDRPKKPKKEEPEDKIVLSHKQKEAVKAEMLVMVDAIIKVTREQAVQIVLHHGRNCLCMNAYCAKKIAADIVAGKTYGAFEKLIHDTPSIFMPQVDVDDKPST